MYARAFHASNTDDEANIALKDADGNSVAQFARVGSGTNAHRGRLILRDNNTITVNITAGSTDNYITNTNSDAKLGINTTTPVDALTVVGNISASGELTVEDKINPTLIGFEKTTTTHGDSNGDVVYFGGNVATDAGQIYYYTGTTWAKTNANSVNTSSDLIAVALGAESDKQGMLIRGMVTLDHDPGQVGDKLYLSSTTAGRATSTAPSTANHVVRLIGYCLDSTNGQIFFNPDMSYIVHD